MLKRLKTGQVFLIVCIVYASIIAQQRIDLYPAGAVPGSRGNDTLKDVPCIYVYQPTSTSRNGSAMVICPGGAYNSLSMASEGSDEAAYYAKKGMTCFVLRYRLCSSGYTRYFIRNDGLRAMRLVRARAKQWGLDTARIGVMGFSAGGHMASMMSTQFDDGNPAATDSIDRVSCRPSFSVLGYPVITCTLPYAWGGLRDNGNFIGPNPSAALVDSFSSEKQISTKTPMAYLFNDTTDWAVPYQNCILYRDSCLKKNVPVTYLRVRGCYNSHGFGMSCGNWADSAAAWMNKQGIFTPTSTVRFTKAVPAPSCDKGVSVTMERGRLSISFQVAGDYNIKLQSINGRMIFNGSSTNRKTFVVPARLSNSCVAVLDVRGKNGLVYKKRLIFN
jgi:acetyl esterase/lipase